MGEVPATLENVSNGSYKTTRPLNLVVATETNDGISKLIAFSKSEVVHQIITDLSYTPAAQ